MKTPTLILTACIGAFAACATVSVHAKSPHSIALKPIGTVAAGSFLSSAAEIVAHDPGTQRLFVVNAQAAQIDIVSIKNPAAPEIIGTIDVTPFGAVANSVAVHGDLIAVAVEADPKTSPGTVAFFNTKLKFIGSVPVGAQPDMLAFTPDGKHVLTANEGEPSEDYTVDPAGSISIIDVSRGRAGVTVRTAGFAQFNAATLDPSIRIFGPGATVATNIEPEYLTISQDSKTAYVTLQENNALAVVDIASATVTRLIGLGTKNHALAANALDASDRDGIPVANDGRVNIANWPVQGFYLPDGIASYKVGNQTYLVLANEGDVRDWDGYSEETRVGSVVLDPAAFPNAVDLKKTSALGRLKITTAQGDTDGDGDYDKLFSFGARSFSIRTTTGAVVFDSGSEFEKITAAQLPASFNASNDNNRFDDRSDDKGPEPEGVTIGKVFGRTYAFIGLERIGGIMVYDITSPQFPAFVQFINNRDFTQPVEAVDSGDLGPEGLLFIAEDNSPCGKPLLVVANEVSGTTTIYEINKVK